MSYKSILVQVDNGPSAKDRLRVTFDLAAHHEAHVTGLFLVPPPRADDIHNIATYGAYTDLYRKMDELAVRDAQDAQALFTREALAATGVQVEWRKVSGDAVKAACVSARYHDLVVLGQFDPTHPVEHLSPSFPEEVVMGAGRPVLVVPHAGQFATLGERPLIAWNASSEATRALTDALPMLRTAKQATVLTIGQKPGRATHGEVPGADIALYLARHGVDVDVKHVNPVSTSVNYPVNASVDELLLSTAADLGSDLIVMGLYGHSRLRELVLGGVSRGVLASMTLPVLMAH